MKKIVFYTISICLVFTSYTSAQFLKKKASKNKFECGYVHKKTLKERLNVTALVGRAVGGLFKKGASKFEYGETAITFTRANHIYPLGYVDQAFKLPGWEVCGTFISTFALSKRGLPLIQIPKFSIDKTPYKPVVFGQFMGAFPHTDTKDKQVVIEDNDGTQVAVDLKAMKGFTIKSVNGVPRWDTSLKYDGSTDMIIELDNVVDPTTKIGVELHNKITGVRFNAPVFYSEDKTRLTIPKEAFRNSMKFIEDNMLIVYKYKETLLDDKSIGKGAMRMIDAYYDFTPITIEGKMKKSFVSKVWKKENQKVNDKDLSEVTKYNFEFKKGDPLYYHPSSEIKKITIPSFVVRANLKHQHIDVTTSSTPYTITTTKTTLTKRFPKLNQETWQGLADRLYTDFEKIMKEQYQAPVVDVKDIVKADSYKKITPIIDTLTQNFAEAGAFGTQRVLPSARSNRQVLKTTNGKSATEAKAANKGSNLVVGINTFPSDFVSSRVMKEFGANCAITVNFDLEFDMQADALFPIVSIRFYAPNMGHTGMLNYYQEVQAYFKESISIEEINKVSGNYVDKLYTMIDADSFLKELKFTLEQISKTEKENPVYQKMWDAMH